MIEYTNSKKKNKELKPKNKKDNPYNFINIKDTDMKLLIVKYYIELKGKAQYVDVIIAVPRVVNKYYFRISGNLYTSQYQILDTTYNNASSSSAKNAKVVVRASRPIRIFKKKSTKDNRIMLMTIDKEEVDITHFICKVFSKMFGICKYILAKFGLNETINMMGFGQVLFITDKPMDTREFYVFHRHKIYINVVKDIFNADETLQSLVHNIYHSIYKDTEYCDIFSISYWLKNLGREFNAADTEEKGIQLLISLEGVYDIRTKEVLKINEWYKQDVYHVMLWAIREFSSLMLKDNLNLAAKRIRCEEYIASLYAAKLTTNLYRISNTGKKNKLTIDKIKKVVCTLPMYLISAVSKCNLINYRDLVHDMDSMVMLAYTFKEIAGIGNETMNSVQAIMRHVDISHTDRLDLDSSKKSDPGLTGSLLPTVKIYDEGYFSDWNEPDTYIAEHDDVIKTYQNAKGLRDVLTFEQEILGIDRREEIKEAEETVDIMHNLVEPISFLMNSSDIKDIVYTMEFSGTITLEHNNNEDVEE
jgi:hypothetical protein